MTNATVSRLGQANLAGDALAMFEKVFTGEVYTTFESAVLLKGLTRQRQISSGKTASFAAIHDAAASYHTPGTELVGAAIPQNEIVIAIDDLLVSEAFIANIDEAMNHFDVRSPYSSKIGRALALEYDRNCARTLVNAARDPAVLFTNDPVGTSAVVTNSDTNALTLAGSFWTAKQTMEEADVPVDTTPVNALVKPAQWYLLAQEPTLILNSDVGGDGGYSKGTFDMIGGVSVKKSNALPWGTNSAPDTSLPTKYRMDMTNTVAAVFTEDAIGTVQLMGLGMDSFYDPRRQGHHMIAKYAVGHGSLIRKCAYEVKSA